eukprot:m.90220 g.90220  ORF g.90220 m.90220 type:complete len:914 (-) comp12913_c0_seq1:822-3563(-)
MASASTVKPTRPVAKTYYDEASNFITSYMSDKKVQRDEVALWVKQERRKKFVEEYPALFAIVATLSGVNVWMLPESHLENPNANDMRMVLKHPCGGVVAATLCCTQGWQTAHLIYCTIDSAKMGNARLEFVACPTLAQSRTPPPESISLPDTPLSLKSNQSYLVVALERKMVVYDTQHFKVLHQVNDIVLTPHLSKMTSSIALGDRWLAYPCADEFMVLPVQDTSTAAQTLVSMATATTSNLMKYGGEGIKAVTTMISGHPPASSPSFAATTSSSHRTQQQQHQQSSFVADECPTTPTATRAVTQGSVRIVDLETKSIIASFKAHASPIVNVTFNLAGTLLATADSRGQQIQVFALEPQRVQPFRHLYTLNRGVTTAHICDVSFSWDDRLVSVASARGTVHIYAIHPRGLAVSARTHTLPIVPNYSTFALTSGEAALAPSQGPTVLTAINKIRCEIADLDSFLTQAFARYPDTEAYVASNRNHGPAMTTAFRLSAKAHNMCNFQLVTLTNKQTVVEFGLAPQVASEGVKEGLGEVVFDRVVAGVAGFIRQHWAPVPHAASHSQKGDKTHQRKSPQNGAVGTEEGSDSAFQLSVNGLRQWQLHQQQKAKPSQDTASHWQAPAIPADLLTSTYNPFAMGDATTSDTMWLSELEGQTHCPPHRRLWMGPQFHFKVFCPAERSEQSRSCSRDVPVPEDMMLDTLDDSDDDVGTGASSALSLSRASSTGTLSAGAGAKAVRSKYLVDHSLAFKPMSAPDSVMLEDMPDELVVGSPHTNVVVTQDESSDKFLEDLLSAMQPETPTATESRRLDVFSLASAPIQVQQHLSQLARQPADGVRLDQITTTSEGQDGVTFQMGTSPGTEDTGSLPSRPSLSSSPGLALALEDDDLSGVSRVHSNVSLQDFADAMSDDNPWESD